MFLSLGFSGLYHQGHWTLDRVHFSINIYILCYIYWLLSVETHLYAKNEINLIVVCGIFNMLNLFESIILRVLFVFDLFSSRFFFIFLCC